MEFLNDGLPALTGFSPRELPRSGGRPLDGIILPEDRQKVVESIGKAVEDLKTFKLEYRVQAKSGKILFLTDQGTPVAGPDGKADHVDGFIFDLSYEKFLQETKKRFEFIADISKDFLTLITRDYVYEAANKAYCIAHGKALDQIVGRTVKEVWGEKGFNVIRQYLDKCLAGEEVHYQMKFQFAFLGLRWFDVAYYPYSGPDGRVSHVIVVSRDVTDRKEAEIERDRLAAAIEQSGEGVLITKKDGSIIFANPTFQKMTGYSRDELLLQNPRMFKSGEHSAQFYFDLYATLDQGRTWTGRIVNRRKDGTLVHLDTTITPVRDDSGQVTNFIAIQRDITPVVAMEKHLRFSQKMDAIGRLAGGIAHDFNNILGVIMGFADISRFLVPPEGELRQNLEEIIIAGERGQHLIKQILTFSRKSELKRVPVDLKTIIAETAGLLKATVPKMISLQIEVRFEHAFILGDPTQMHQVLMNLVTNAVLAIGGKSGEIRVSLSKAPPPKESEMPGEQVFCLTVNDTGVGMDPATLEKIFEPYFSTRPFGEGTGLGLALVHGIVRENGGVVEAESELGKGSTFRIYLPIHDFSDSPVDVRNESPVGKRGRILLVEDEAQMVEVGKKALALLGFEVMGCTDGVTALEIFLASPLDFDVVMTDLNMPGLGGLAVVKEIRKVRPEIPVILCSGFGSTAISSEQIAELGIQEILSKPYVIANLEKALKKALG